MATTDQTLLSAVQTVVLEAPNGGLTFPSGLWTPEEVVTYANQRQADLLKRALVTRVRATIPTIPNNTRHQLPADWILSTRVAWQRLPAPGTILGLRRGDELEIGLATPNWEYQPVAADPYVYMDGDTPALQIQVAPPSQDAGLLHLCYVAIGETLTGGGVTLTIPDLLVPTLKYGILADMFSKLGRAFDPTRAALCEARYAMGIAASQILMAGFR